MVHDDYKEMIPARALSALDAAEERALNEHLENCAECRKELEDWQATAAALSLAPDPAEPSPKVRERILSEVRKDLSSTPEVIPFRSTSRNIWSSVRFAGRDSGGCALCGFVSVGGHRVGDRIVRLRNDSRASNEFVELVNTPGARVSELRGIDPGAECNCETCLRSNRSCDIDGQQTSAHSAG